MSFYKPLSLAELIWLVWLLFRQRTKLSFSRTSSMKSKSPTPSHRKTGAFAQKEDDVYKPSLTL